MFRFLCTVFLFQWHEWIELLLNYRRTLFFYITLHTPCPSAAPSPALSFSSTITLISVVLEENTDDGEQTDLCSFMVTATSTPGGPDINILRIESTLHDTLPMFVTYTQLLTCFLPILAKNTTVTTSEQRTVAIERPSHQIPQRTRQGTVGCGVKLPCKLFNFLANGLIALTIVLTQNILSS